MPYTSRGGIEVSEVTSMLYPATDLAFRIASWLRVATTLVSSLTSPSPSTGSKVTYLALSPYSDLLAAASLRALAFSTCLLISRVCFLARAGL